MSSKTPSRRETVAARVKGIREQYASLERAGFRRRPQMQIRSTPGGSVGQDRVRIKNQAAQP